LEAHIYGLNQNLANIESDSLDLEKEIFCLRSIETDAERTLLITKSLHDFSKSSITTMSSRNWQLADIQAGIPIIYKENIAKFIPQMVNLDLINGISFNKGCYTGQEIVARVQHRGKIKRRMFHISTQQSNTEIRPGTPVLLGDSEVGTIIQSVQYKNQISLAVIREDVSKKKLLVNGIRNKGAKLDSLLHRALFILFLYLFSLCGKNKTSLIEGLSVKTLSIDQFQHPILL
jgi:folate-binding protein YgfZ